MVGTTISRPVSNSDRRSPPTSSSSVWERASTRSASPWPTLSSSTTAPRRLRRTNPHQRTGTKASQARLRAGKRRAASAAAVPSAAIARIHPGGDYSSTEVPGHCPTTVRKFHVPRMGTPAKATRFSPTGCNCTAAAAATVISTNIMLNSRLAMMLIRGDTRESWFKNSAVTGTRPRLLVAAASGTTSRRGVVDARMGRVVQSTPAV